MNEFKLTIKLGNDAMQSHEDVATALDEAAEEVRQGLVRGRIFDYNGNTVGSWEFSRSTLGTPE